MSVEPEELLASSVIKTQEASKWISGAFAAIGAVLLGGLQLNAVGTLSFDKPVASGVALLTMTTALVTVGLVLARAANVLVPPLVTLPELVRRELRARSASSQGEDFWVSDFLLRSIRSERGSLLQSGATGPHDLYEKLTRARALGEGQAEPLERDAKRLTDFAGLRMTQHHYQQLVGSLLLGGALIALCVVLFSWAVNSSEDKPEARVTQPLAVRVILTGAAQSLPTAKLRPSCAAQRDLTGVAVAGELREPEVVIPPTSLCPALRFTVTRDIGIAVPVLSGTPSTARNP
jgi:hypothetical protein